MSIFTYEEVTRAAQQATDSFSIKESIRNESADDFFLNESKKGTSKIATQFDIFLSHAYKDKFVVAGLYKLLTTAGYTVYVDWIHDRGLNRGKVTSATARILQRRMHQSKSLMYATIKEDTNSRWMPWEAGYFHGHDGHVAILPVVKNTNSFSGQEYLGLYPYAEKSSIISSGRNHLRIVDQSVPYRTHAFTAWLLKAAK